MPFKDYYHRVRHKPLITISYFIVRNIVAPIVKLIWVKHVEGIKNIPKHGPAIIAFNHQSYFDFICFIAVSPRNIHFISAEKFFLHPIWRPIMKITGQIKVDRENRDKHETHTLVHEHLDAGKMIGIFPEGTRSPDRNLMLKAFTGVAKYAVYKKVPIIPVGIKGTYDVMAKHDRMPRFSKIVSIITGEPIDGHKFLVGNLGEDEYRRITDDVMKKIAILSEKTYPF